MEKFIKWYKLAGLYFLKFFKKYYLIIAMALVTIVALIARYAVVMFPTGDSVGFMVGTDSGTWMNQIEAVGFRNFYTIESDYSPIFLFFLAILTFLPKGNVVSYGTGGEFYSNRMIYVKTLYYLAAIGLAFGVFLLVKEITKSKNKGAVGYIIALLLPSLFVNSSIYGNADVIYVGLLIYAFYFAIKGDSIWTFAFFGFAFANKAQAIFILPFLVYLLFKRKLKLWSIVIAPLAYIVTFIPAFVCGASLAEPFTYLTKQFGGQTALTYGAATIWKFLEFDKASDVLVDGAPWIALFGIGCVLALALYRNFKLEEKTDMFKVGISLSMITIFLLPRMHERYFLLIDVLLIIYVILDKKKFYLLLLMQISSAIVYFHYISFNDGTAAYGWHRYLINILGEDSVTIASLINLFIIGVMIHDLFKLDHKPLKEEVEELDKEITQLEQAEVAQEKDLEK